MTPDMPATDTAAANLPPAALSLHDDPAWRAIVRRGVTLLLIATAVVPALILGAAVYDTQMVPASAVLGAVLYRPYALVPLALVAALPFAALGAWLLTTRRRVAADSFPTARDRRMTRCSVVLGTLIVAACAVVALAGAAPDSLTPVCWSAACAAMIWTGWGAPSRYLEALGAATADTLLLRRAAAAGLVATLLAMCGGICAALFVRAHLGGVVDELTARVLPVLTIGGAIGLTATLATVAAALSRAQGLLAQPDPRAPESDVVAVDQGHAAVAADLLCRTCGYNLRGLRPDGHCPECAAGIAPTVRASRLRFADPDWLARVRHGTTLLVSALLAWLGLLLLIYVTTQLLRAYPATPTESTFHVSVIVVPVLRLTLSSAAILAAVGAWRVTTRQPRIPDRISDSRLRWWVRAVFLCYAAGTCGLMAVGSLRSIASDGASYIIYSAIAMLCPATAIIGAALLAALVRQLATRLPDSSLRASAGSLLATALLLLGIPVVDVGAFIAFGLSGVRFGPTAVIAANDVLNTLAAAGTATVLLLALFTLVRLRRALAAQLAAARAYQPASAPDRHREDHP